MPQSETYHIIRAILEIIYFISGPVIAYFAIYVIRQIRVQREASQISARRESYRIAVEQCEIFSTVIYPKIEALEKNIEKKGLEKFLQESKVEISGHSISVIYNFDHSNDKQKIIEVSSELKSAINSLKSFALFFTSRVASEEIAFGSVGANFCSVIQKLWPLIMTIATREEFESINELYIVWQNRIEMQQILVERELLNDRLKSIDNNRINPIGVN